MGAKLEQAEFSLDEKYAAEDGVVLISGIQALVRALQTRVKLDLAQGRDIGGFVSGYRGSPLGGLDKALWSQSQNLAELGIVFQPGVNEDLAATAVWGTQQVGLHPGATKQGAFGMWYGKAPGLDRSCDAIRHANAWGASKDGGVLLVVGDDPAAKSSSLSSQSEFTLQDMQVPLLSPSSVQEVLDFAVLGWELSRRSGLWVALKAVADHMDSSATVEVGLDRYAPVVDKLANETVAENNEADTPFIRRLDTPLDQERRMVQQKLPAALASAHKLGINRWVTENLQVGAGKAKLGIITSGSAYQDLREACAQLGWTSLQDIRAQGIEILKLGMVWPLDDTLVREFAERVEGVFVLEEKRRFIEPQVKEALYGASQVPVHGKRHAAGQPLLDEFGTLSIATIANVLVNLVDVQVEQQLEAGFLQRVTQTERAVAHVNAPARDERTPLFCAGCPHNTSTRVPEGSRATAGIGCHYMVQWMDRDTDSCTHMGGEGVTWVGESPFVEEPHIFANLGDGTYFHSGILAIRQAVAAQVNITYKVLFNDAVAMTGGQPTDGELSVPKLIAQVQAEGVERVVIVSDEPELHSDLAGRGIEVFHRSELDNVQRMLRDVSGVSVLVYQQTCATELRRRRKRGMVEDFRPRLFINEAVCEGCGDCTVQSNCVAVEPKETAFGVKRAINQSSCNKDLSCATGFCPAFVEVEGELKLNDNDDGQFHSLRQALPTPGVNAQANILVTGVGGTGIVTVSALLAAAARLDGKSVRTLDMTGLAQKGGAVFAHIRIAQAGEDTEQDLFSARIPQASSDVLIGCDLVSAASNESLAYLSGATQAIVNTHIMPTSDFVLSQSHDTQLRKRLGRVRDLVGDVHTFAAEDHAEQLLGDTLQANVMLLGYAFQKGLLGVSLNALHRAIRINGVAIERNLAAFDLGRVAAHDASLLPMAQPSRAQLPQTEASLGLEDVISHRQDHLTAYGSQALAARYAALVQKAADAEQQLSRGSEQLAREVALSYAKLLAPKDEFEVARLYSDGQFAQNIAQQFAAGARVRYLMAPPLLGTKKRSFGPWMGWMLKGLAKLRWLRGSVLNPFGYSAEHKQSAQLLSEFEALMGQLLDGLTRQNLPIAVAIVRLAQSMRGYGHVKAAHVAKAKAEQARLLEEFTASPQPVNVFDPSSDRAKAQQAA